MCLIFYEAGSLHSLKIAEQRIATSGFNASHSIYGHIASTHQRRSPRSAVLNP